MDLLEATQDRIIRKVSGEDRTFCYLTARERADLLRADLERRKKEHKERRQEVLDNLTAAGITGEQMFAELEHHADLAPKTVTEQDWIDFVNDVLNEQDILIASLRRVHGADAEKIAEAVNISLSDKAAICGLSVVSAKQGTTDPNQPIPASYQTPGVNSTGSPAPTE